MITRDQDNPSIRYMFPIKSSLAPEGKAVAFLFDEENGFHWIGPCVLNQEGINMQPPGRKKERVRDLIRLMLSSGDQASNYMFEQLEQLGFSEKTIKLAKKELGVETYRKAGGTAQAAGNHLELCGSARSCCYHHETSEKRGRYYVDRHLCRFGA